jgi:hypothetical protein
MDMPVIIPVLATGYLLTIYLLLMLAQRTIKNSQYINNSLADTYGGSIPTDHNSQILDEGEELSYPMRGNASFSPERPSTVSATTNVQEASSMT